MAMQPASKRARKASSLRDKDAVCEVWKDTRLEPEPYFVTLATKSRDGVLSYDTTSQKLSFKRLRFPVTHPLSSFEVEGLIFCRHQGVFNVHNRTWHAIPPAPEESKYRPAIGMVVDTAEAPFTFKLIMGSVDKKTQVYDSRTASWSTRASKVMQVAKSALNSPTPVACVCIKGHVYISIGGEILLVYFVEGDKWNILDSPKGKQGKGGCALGAWNGKIFTTREDSKEKNLTVWELVDQTKQEWVEYAVMPKEPYDMVCGSQKNGVCLLPCFRDGYLLIYNRQCFSAAVVLDLATKKWKQVDMATEGGSEDEGEKVSENEGEKSSEGEGEGSGDEGEGSDGEEGGSEDENEGSEGKEGTSDDGEDEEGFEDEQGEDDDDDEEEEENTDGSDDNGGEEDDGDSSEDDDEE